MYRAVIAIVCCFGLIGCVHVNQGSRPLGSIVGQAERQESDVSDQSVAQHLVAAVPGRR